jgi:hypothetical protein
VERDSLYQTVRERFDDLPPSDPDGHVGVSRGTPARVHAA